MAPDGDGRAGGAADAYEHGPSRVAELVLAAVLHIPPRTPLGRAALKAAIVARRLLVERRDPLVRHRVGEIELLLPLSHQLPVYRHDHPLYDTPLARLAALLSEKHSPLTVVDVGANVGDTAAAVRSAVPEAPLLCVEGHARFFELLRRNARRFQPPLELEHALVSGSSGPAAATLEAADGTARLRPRAGSTVLLETLAEILALHPTFAEPRLVKLDTDGHDCAILRAANELLARARPLVFFEYDPDSVAAEDGAVFADLAAVGYRHALAFENTGEFVAAFDVGDPDAVARLRARYGGHRGARYADVAVFHEDDGDVAARAQRAEAAGPYDPV